MGSHIYSTFSRMVGCAPFPELQNKFCLPQSMYFYYLQLHHASRAQTGIDDWVQSPTPIFNYISEVEIYKGFISRCYYMLLCIFLKGFPLRAESRWEQDVGAFEEEQWEEALQAVQSCSLNVTQSLCSYIFFFCYIFSFGYTLLLRDYLKWG